MRIYISSEAHPIPGEDVLAFFQEFSQGAKSIVMQIYFVMLIFYCFRTKVQGVKSPRGANCLGGPVEESQMCVPGEAHPLSRWGCSFHCDSSSPEWGCASSGCTSSLGMGMCLIGNAYPPRIWGCASPGIHILTGNDDVPHQECTSSPVMGMFLTGNAHPHRECISSPGMHIVYTGWTTSACLLDFRLLSKIVILPSYANLYTLLNIREVWLVLGRQECQKTYIHVALHRFPVVICPGVRKNLKSIFSYLALS